MKPSKTHSFWTIVGSLTFVLLVAACGGAETGTRNQVGTIDLYQPTIENAEWQPNVRPLPGPQISRQSLGTGHTDSGAPAISAIHLTFNDFDRYLPLRPEVLKTVMGSITAPSQPVADCSALWLHFDVSYFAAIDLSASGKAEALNITMAKGNLSNDDAASAMTDMLHRSERNGQPLLPCSEDTIRDAVDQLFS